MSRPSPALILAVTALFAALAGGAYAAKAVKKNTVVTKSIKRGAVTGPKVRDNAVYSGQILDGGIIGADLARGAISSDKFAPGVEATKTAGGVITGSTQARTLTLGNWTVRVVTDAAGLCATFDIKAAGKPGRAGYTNNVATVAANGITVPVPLTAAAGLPVGAVSDDGTSSFTGSLSVAPVGASACSYSIAMTGY
ncbi:MAG: hypothetical protein QOG62_316 [Thermoleophilaceae bacterium]|nr:hypothetical protein [Thermoleophilaceae bacterium]